jgi:hypothetical protein
VRVILIDYARTHYTKALPDKFSGKFVQMRKGTSEYLIFSPRESDRYHADIIERFCAEHKIAGIYNHANKHFSIHDPSWSVVGGGKFEIDRERKYLRLYDNSMAYGKFAPRGLKWKILALDIFSGYEVRVE